MADQLGQPTYEAPAVSDVASLEQLTLDHHHHKCIAPVCDGHLFHQPLNAS